ncbi:pectate lyase [Crossiella sp. SN42]|uniref:pectate lyase n=1 Tax=Crossiella sp. SN42 TaxID=2944808 RepID=UPI00207C28A6|nr:pectate lyase [Crossiella sp. SN42]MCO1576921.1 pectate lyase [Crossiella sp. SN42]
MSTPLSRRSFARLTLAPAALTLLGGGTAQATTAPAGLDRGAVVRAMGRAAVFLDRQVSCRGGYLWSYLPDLSACWGELAARRSMCWVQPPGTPSVGHSLLDAYHATGAEECYRAAERTGLALVAAQLPSGGWNYVHDFAGTGALRRWYHTVGANGWRQEEFQHHYGNATFDDAGTSAAAQLILRLYLARRDPRFKAALARAIRFVLAAQFRGGVADGGWPQRFPAFAGSVSRTHWPAERPPWLPADVRHGLEDGEYTQHVTFNDDVLGENIKFLLLCATSLRRPDLFEPVHRAMRCLQRMQQPGPQAGWALQHLSRAARGRPAGAPAGARSYEPRALATHTTQTNIRQLFHYFRLTGDRSYLARVPEAIDWLSSCPLTERQLAENPLLAKRTHPTFVELGTNRALFVHRFGSNIRNGAYYTDHDHRDTLGHYSAGRAIDLDGLRRTHAELSSLSGKEIAELRARSPLTPGPPIPLPRHFSVRELELTDLCRDANPALPTVSDAEAGALVRDLGGKDHWLTPAETVTNPFRGRPPADPSHGKDFMSTHVGDRYDTSPFPPAERPLVISTGAYVANMAKLIAWADR